MKLQSALILGLAVTFPLSAQSAIINGYGAYASAGSASNCPSYCTSSDGGDFQSMEDGAEFSTSASASESSYATANAYSSLSGSTYLPTLKVDSSADAGVAGYSTAFGVQGYTYSGSTTTIYLDVSLHGSVEDNAGSAYKSNNLSASVAVLMGNSLDWYPSYGTLVYEVSTLPVVGEVNVGITSGIDVTATDVIELILEDGDEFFVVAQMSAYSNNGYVDAWNTLMMGFNDEFGNAADAGLTAASVSAVPVPAAVWLFGSGLLGLVGIARRRS